MTLSETKYVFVYGTLMQGYGNHRVLEPYGTFVDTAIMPGLVMLDIGFFPGVIKGKPSQMVKGEVYELHDQQKGLAHMDKLENHPSIYHREVAQAQLSNGQTVQAWVYLWQKETEFTVIWSGDYRAYHPPLKRVKQ